MENIDVLTSKKRLESEQEYVVRNLKALGFTQTRELVLPDEKIYYFTGIPGHNNFEVNVDGSGLINRLPLYQFLAAI